MNQQNKRKIARQDKNKQIDKFFIHQTVETRAVTESITAEEIILEMNTV